jgi:phage FluMu protein Com
MKCPKCKEHIETVSVLSYYTQSAALKGRTNHIDSDGWESGIIGDTISIYCPKCDENITSTIKE